MSGPVAKHSSPQHNANNKGDALDDGMRHARLKELRLLCYKLDTKLDG